MDRRSGVPAIAAGVLALALVALPALAAPALGAGPTVTVRSGDTLSAIALRHHTTVARLVALNHLTDPNRIYVGQRLLTSASAAGTATGAGSRPTPASRTHVVVAGEHLTGVALRYGTTVATLVRLNRIVDPNRIYAGQRLTVPAAASAGPTPSSGSSRGRPMAPTSVIHRIAPGENLTLIARHYGTSIAAIVSANRLADPSFIRAGELLRIPGARAGGPSVAPVGGHIATDDARRMAARSVTRDLIAREARRAGVPASLALAVAWQESGWQQGVVSSAGAIGVMQLTPATGEWVASAMLGRAVNLRDAGQNVRAGVTLLHHYLVRYHGDRERTLAAYYQGQRAVDEHGIYPVSRPYIASILALEALFGS